MINDEKIPELTKEEFRDFVRKGLVFIDFFTEWNMQSLMMSPIIEEISDEFKNIKFGKIDISENNDIIKKLKVTSAPTFLVFKDGEIVSRFVGTMFEEELEERLKKFN